MAAHRYWRAVSLQAYGVGGLELSEFQLLAGPTRVDAAAALTASTAPAAGMLVNLKDDALGTGAAWPAADLKTLVLTWDLGAGGAQDVSDVRLGAMADRSKFLMSFKLQFSDDALAWSDSFVFAGITWPGANTKTSSVLDDSGSKTVTLLHFNGANGATTFTDEKGKVYTAAGNAQLTTASPIFIGASLLLDGAGDWVQTTTGLTDFAFGTGDFIVECRFKTTANRAQCLIDFYVNNGSGYAWQLWLNSQSIPEFYRGGPLSGAVITGKSAVTASDPVRHVAVVRRSGRLMMFVDRAFVAAVDGDTTDYTNTGAGQLAIGAQVGVRNASYDFAGQIDEVRIVKGSAGTWRASDFSIGADVEYDLFDKSLIARSAPVRAAQWTPVGAGPAISYGRVAVAAFARGRKDYQTGVLGEGIGRVRGYTLDYVNPLNKPYPCRVVLIREAGNLPLREQWSKADGSYDFQFVDELQSYTVIAYYLAHGKRAVVTDGLTLANGKVELMP
jgi:hypothetical protein